MKDNHLSLYFTVSDIHFNFVAYKLKQKIFFPNCSSQSLEPEKSNCIPSSSISPQ